MMPALAQAKPHAKVHLVQLAKSRGRWETLCRYVPMTPQQLVYPGTDRAPLVRRNRDPFCGPCMARWFRMADRMRRDMDGVRRLAYGEEEA